MLSRLALLPRAGLATASLTRQVATPSPFVRAAVSSTSPWIRTYAKGKDTAPKSSDSQKKPASDAEPAQSTSEAPEAAEPEKIPFDKLPDLTQGIPSTFAAEMAERAGHKQPSYLQAVEESESGERGRDRRDEYVSTNERNRKWWTRFMLGLTASGAVGGMVYLGRNWEDEIESARHPDVPNGWGIGLWWARVNARWNESVSYYQDPAFDKLLPDPDPTFERPYTLCLSLDDLLVHSEWSREHGWRVAKRPGMDYFVRYLSQYYELVLFTTVPFAMGEPLVRKLDPFRFIMWPLYREATKYEDGEIVKVRSFLSPF